MNIEKNFCTTREAAIMLGISTGTAQLWVDNGLLTAWKTEGGHRRITRESIDKLLNQDTTISSDAVVAIGANGSNGLRVLVVEDSSNLRRLYEIVMSQWPMAPQVTLVDNGINAIMMLERVSTDLLVLDLDTPGLDGFELVRILKSDKKHINLTIVVVSGMDQIEVMKRGGVPQDVLVFGKPVPFAKLLAVAVGIENKKNDLGPFSPLHVWPSDSMTRN